jgi:hypothetical protein
MRRSLLALILLASPLAAATTLEPTAEGLAIRARAYREHLVFIILKDGTSYAAKAPLKITSRSVTFTDAADKQLYLMQLADLNMEATTYVNTQLIPQGRWMDEKSYALKDLELRALSYEELQRAIAEVDADLEEAKEAYRDAYTSAACSGKVGASAELCAMNATASADRKIKVIEAKAETEY